MKFPLEVRLKKKDGHKAIVYAKTGDYGYRVSWTPDGKPRQMKTLPNYSKALEFAKARVDEMDKGVTVNLNDEQIREAERAFACLKDFYVRTGRKVSLLDAVSQFTESSAKLTGHSLGEAVEGFTRNVRTVTRKPLSEAVTDFIASRKHLAMAKEGKRAQLSSVYAYNVAMWLKEFAGTLRGLDVRDLLKENLATYIGKHKELSAKSRNDRRATVRMFLAWCARQDYLSQTHRLFEADAMKRELVDLGEIDFYRPTELADMLEKADSEPEYKDLLPMLALGGLAGLRVEECLRLNWADVWRTTGHVEITARIAKGRKRRLVDMPENLQSWLAPFKEFSGPVWKKSSDAFHETLTRLRESLKIPSRRNGLRHGFITFHFALHSNENLTAAQAGNSPQMIHEHYRGLARKADAEKWFAVAPVRPDNVLPMKTEGAA